MDRNSSLNKTNHLLIIKDHQRIEYQGPFKLKIEKLNDCKHLYITPSNEDYKLITVSFESKFIKQKNILCVFDKLKSCNFALCFYNEALCEKVYNIISKNFPQLSSEESKKEFYNKFLTPLCKTINDTLTPQIFYKEILKDLWNAYEGNEKDAFLKYLKKRKVEDFVFAKEERQTNEETENAACNNENERNENGFVSNERNIHGKNVKTETISEIEEPPSKKRKTIETSDRLSPILSEVNMNETVSQSNRNSSIIKAETGDEFDINNHSSNGSQCGSVLTEPLDIDVVNNFEENQSGGTLSENEDLNQNHEEPNSQNIHLADGRNIYNFRKRQSNLISSDQDTPISDDDFENDNDSENDESGEEIDNFSESAEEEEDENICETNLNDKCLNSGKKNKEKKKSKKNDWIIDESKIIRSPNFLLKCNNKMEPKSYIFIISPNDPTMFYKYCKGNGKNNYICAPCQLRKKYCRAKIIEYEGEECILVKNFDHVCELRSFDQEEMKKKIILKRPDFELRPNRNNVPNSNLIIFHHENKNLRYKFYYNRSKKIYTCSKCRNKKKCTYAKLYQSENGEEYITIKENDHICIENKSSDKNLIYKLCVTPVRDKMIKKLILFTDKTKNFGYEYTWHNQKQLYLCYPCKNHKSFIYVKLNQNGSQDECLVLGKKEHKCTPINFSIADEKKYLEPQENQHHCQPKVASIYENLIITSSQYKPYDIVSRGEIKNCLAIFSDETTKNGYVYTWNRQKQQFQCLACMKLKISVFAKLVKNNDDEKNNYLELGMKQHQCKPKNLSKIDVESFKFGEIKHTNVQFLISENENKIVKQPNYKIYETVFNGKMRKRIAIFIDEAKTNGYEYSWHDKKKTYRCVTCLTKKHWVTAKLIQINNKNGEDYIKLGKNDHKCEIKDVSIKSEKNINIEINK